MLTFRLRTLFVVCLLAAMGVWAYQWARWPARTLSEFSALIEQSRYDDAAARLDFEHDYLVSPDDVIHRVHVARSVCKHHCQPQPRSLADILYGRQVYTVVGDTACWVDTGALRAHFLIESVTLERGRIRFTWRGPMAGQRLRFEKGEWIRDPIPYAGKAFRRSGAQFRTPARKGDTSARFQATPSGGRIAAGGL